MSQITTVVLGIFAILLGILFEKINVAFMVGLAFAVAASANFPVLLLAMFWKDLTTRGAVVGGFLGLISAFVLTICQPGDLGSGSRQSQGLGAGSPMCPRLSSPCRCRSSAAGCSRSPTIRRRARTEQAAFEAQYVRSQTGIGADTAVAH